MDYMLSPHSPYSQYDSDSQDCRSTASRDGLDHLFTGGPVGGDAWGGAFSRVPSPSLFDEQLSSGSYQSPVRQLQEHPYGPGSLEGPSYRSRFLTTCTMCSIRNETDGKLKALIANLREGDELVPMLQSLQTQSWHFLNQHRHVRNSDWRTDTGLDYDTSAQKACNTTAMIRDVLLKDLNGIRTAQGSSHPNFVDPLDREEQLYTEALNTVTDVENSIKALQRTANSARSSQNSPCLANETGSAFVLKVEEPK